MRRKLSLQTQVILVLAAGFVAGTFFAVFFGDAYIGELGIFSESYIESLHTPMEDVRRFFIYILLQRLGPAAALMVLIYTRWRTHILFALTAWCAFSLGIFWSSCIQVCGMKGILLFILALFPHGLCYAWSWIRLGRAAMERSIRLNWLPGIIPGFLLGAAAETWIHPMILRVVLGTFLIGVKVPLVPYIIV